MTQTNAAKIAKSSMWLTMSFAIVRVSQLIAQIFFARILSPEEFGIWGMVLIVTTLSALFKESAIASVLIQRGLDDKKLVDAVYSLSINVAVGMFILQSLAGYPLSRFFGIPILWPLTACTALVFIVGPGIGSHSAVLQRQMKFKQLAISDSAAGVARFGSGVICALLGYGVWSFAIAEVAGTVVSSVLKSRMSGYHFTYHLIPDQSAIRAVRGYITSLIGINIAVFINTNGDNFIIGKLLGAQALGYYNLAYQLAMLPGFALSQINRVNFSVLSQRDNDGQKAYLCKMLELYAIFAAPTYGVALVIAPWLIPFVYGKQWTPAVLIFQIVIVFAYARGFMSILGTALNAVDKPNVNAAINWALIPVSVSAFYVGAQMGGIKGVAIAVALILGIGATVWFWLAMCRAGRWNIVVLLKPVLLPTATVVVAVAAVLTIPLPVYLQTFLQPLFVVLIYGIAVSVFSGGRIPQILMATVKRSLNKASS
ncbi:MAG: oligosaccharide flippase family protein [Microcoleus sp. SIO2G3]|nr:oligosaccharide flippase family protein [Microcoleus sp. SIO2G3]